MKINALLAFLHAHSCTDEENKMNKKSLFFLAENDISENE
jgi:hypothetical protein